MFVAVCPMYVHITTSFIICNIQKITSDSLYDTLKLFCKSSLPFLVALKLYVFYKAVCRVVLIQGRFLAFLLCSWTWKREFHCLVVYSLDVSVSSAISYAFVLCGILSSAIPDVCQEWLCCQSPCKTAELGKQ